MTKVNEFHWEIILQFIENHPDLAIGRVNGPNAKQSQKILWQQLAEQLNSLGYGKKLLINGKRRGWIISTI